MKREYWYFLSGALTVALPIALVLAIKTLNWFEPQPDALLSYPSTLGRALELHVYRAHGAGDGQLAPALILFHGGGWHSGSPRQFYPQCEFFSGRGVHCISAEYRLGPAHAPDVAGAIEDAGAAFDYLLKNASDLGIDPHRIIVGGGSSGGHLAASVGAGLHGANHPRPAALVLYNPVLDLSPCTVSHHRVKDIWRAVSPMEHINSRIPSTLIMSGEVDSEVPVATLEAYCQALTELGGTCELVLYPRQGHGFFNYRKDGNTLFDRTNDRALSFIQDL